MARKNLDDAVESLIAHKELKSTLGSMDDRVARRYDKVGKGAYTALIELRKRQEDFQGELTHAALRWEEEKLAAARALRLAIEEFKEKYPEHGGILESMIQRQRTERRPHIAFGLNEGCELPVEAYFMVLESIGIRRDVAEKLYYPLMEAGNLLRKGGEERNYSLLVKE